MSYNIFFIIFGVYATLITGCAATTMITNEQIVAETADVLRLHPSAVMIQNRETKDATIFYKAKTQSGDDFNCLIYGKDYRIGARLVNSPQCTKIEVAQPVKEVSQPKKSSKNKSILSHQDKNYIEIGTDKKRATIYVDTKNTRQMGGNIYHAIVKYKFYENTYASNAKVDYAIIDSIVSCGGINRMSVTDYQLFEYPGKVIDENYKNSSMIANLNLNSQNVVLHYFCTE